MVAPHAEGQAAAYQVVAVDVGFCGGTVPPQRIQDTCNQMIAGGYKLHQAYVDVRSQCGPFCPIKCVVLIFKRFDLH
jgi:hypothetical protein